MLNFNELSDALTEATLAAALHYFYILKENSLMLQSVSEYLVSVADTLMSEISGVALVKTWNPGQTFSWSQEAPDGWLFVPSQILHSYKLELEHEVLD